MGIVGGGFEGGVEKAEAGAVAAGGGAVVGLGEGDDQDLGAVARGALAEVPEPVGGRHLPGAEHVAGPADAGLIVERESRLDGAAVGLAVVAEPCRVEELDGAVPERARLWLIMPSGSLAVTSRAVPVVVRMRDGG